MRKRYIVKDSFLRNYYRRKLKYIVEMNRYKCFKKEGISKEEKHQKILSLSKFFLYNPL